MKIFAILLLFFLILVTGCANRQSDSLDTQPAQLVLGVPAPATFSGRLPGIDCDYYDITLNFRPDGLYQIRQIKVSGIKKDSFSEMGHWKYDPTEKLLVLGTKRGSLKTLSLIDNNTLRLLDIEGRKISADVTYNLSRDDEFASFEDTVPMRGMYTNANGKASLVECQNGVHFTVAKGTESTKLNQSYNNTPHGQGEALLVTIDGSLHKKFGEEELTVDRFHEINPEQDCTGAVRKNKLFNSTWNLRELDGKEVVLVEGQREPFVTLEIEGNRMHGFSGCNRFFGTYLVKGEIFVFNKMAGTRMACLKGLDLENDFLRAMHETEAYRIVDGVLELRDRDENILARLQEAK